VVHAAYGVGRIVQLAEQEFAGVSGLYYEVAAEKSTFWVRAAARPGEGAELRPVADSAVLARCRRLLKGKPASLNADHRERQVEVAARLKSGAFLDLCEVVRDLTARGWRKPLNDADAGQLRKVRERLCQEWAAAEGRSPHDAAQEMDALLRTAREAYAV
jgi:CarD family transcriptional regulator